MKAQSLKHLIGWYASRTRKGGRARRQHQGPHVQGGTPADNDETARKLARVLSRLAGTRERLERWLAWASVTDETGPTLGGRDYELLSLVREWAETAGHLTPRLQIPPMERHTWTNLNERMEEYRRRVSTRQATLEDHADLSQRCAAVQPQINSKL